MNTYYLSQLVLMVTLFVILDLTSSEICIEQYDYKPSLLHDINSSDLVIAHAGAGTCLEGK